MSECPSSSRTVSGVLFSEDAIKASGLPNIQLLAGVVLEDSHSLEEFEQFAEMGVKFAQLKYTTEIGDTTGLKVLAQQVMFCQQTGIVPLVSPFLKEDGWHNMVDYTFRLEAFWCKIFEEFKNSKVSLESLIFMPNFVADIANAEEHTFHGPISDLTLGALKRSVPDQV